MSLGGGAVLTPGVREALAGHTVVYLEISAAEGIRRTGGSVDAHFWRGRTAPKSTTP
ncbi:Shikimate kinase (AroK) [Mycobacteroides abscessus]|nr:Shikimate kinase (AroK) [Mycobacteroides abscessus]